MYNPHPFNERDYMMKVLQGPEGRIGTAAERKRRHKLLWFSPIKEEDRPTYISEREDIPSLPFGETRNLLDYGARTIAAVGMYTGLRYSFKAMEDTMLGRTERFVRRIANPGLRPGYQITRGMGRFLFPNSVQYRGGIPDTIKTALKREVSDQKQVVKQLRKSRQELFNRVNERQQAAIDRITKVTPDVSVSDFNRRRKDIIKRFNRTRQGIVEGSPSDVVARARMRVSTVEGGVFTDLRKDIQSVQSRIDKLDLFRTQAADAKLFTIRTGAAGGFTPTGRAATFARKVGLGRLSSRISGFFRGRPTMVVEPTVSNHVLSRFGRFMGRALPSGKIGVSGGILTYGLLRQVGLDPTMATLGTVGYGLAKRLGFDPMALITARGAMNTDLANTISDLLYKGSGKKYINPRMEYQKVRQMSNQGFFVKSRAAQNMNTVINKEAVTNIDKLLKTRRDALSRTVANLKTQANQGKLEKIKMVMKEATKSGDASARLEKAIEKASSKLTMSVGTGAAIRRLTELPNVMSRLGGSALRTDSVAKLALQIERLDRSPTVAKFLRSVFNPGGEQRRLMKLFRDPSITGMELATKAGGVVKGAQLMGAEIFDRGLASAAKPAGATVSKALSGSMLQRGIVGFASKAFAGYMTASIVLPFAAEAIKGGTRFIDDKLNKLSMTLNQMTTMDFGGTIYNSNKARNHREFAIQATQSSILSARNVISNEARYTHHSMI